MSSAEDSEETHSANTCSPDVSTAEEREMLLFRSFSLWDRKTSQTNSHDRGMLWLTELFHCPLPLWLWQTILRQDFFCTIVSWPQCTYVRKFHLESRSKITELNECTPFQKRKPEKMAKKFYTFIPINTTRVNLLLCVLCWKTKTDFQKLPSGLLLHTMTCMCPNTDRGTDTCTYAHREHKQIKYMYICTYYIYIYIHL